MKLTLSSSIMENEELLNTIIESYCDEVLKGDLKQKQQFMLDNKLAAIVTENKDSAE